MLQPCYAFGFSHLLWRHPHPCGLHVASSRKSGYNAEQCLKRTDHQSRADQKHQRQRHLHDDQRIARPLTFPARARAARSAGERLAALGGVFHGGKQTKEDAGNNRDDDSKDHHPGIERDVLDARQCRRRRADNHREPAIGEGHSQNAAGEREHQTLDQHFPRDVPSSGAQCRPHRKFVSPAFGSHQHEIGDVGTRDQQHHADCRHQDPQDVPDAAYDLIFQRLQRRRDVPALDHLFSCEVERCRPCVEPDRQHPCDIRVGVRNGDAGLESRETREVEAIESQAPAIDRDQGDHLGSWLHVEESESVGHDANHLGRVGVHEQPPSDH